MFEFISEHQLVAGAIGALILSSAVRALPEPVENGNPFYLWLYRFSHAVLANWDKVASVKSQISPVPKV